MRGYRRIGCALAFVGASSALGIDIVINPGPALGANPAALAAFNRAAAQWESRFSDPITVTINADIAPLGIPTAQAQSVLVLRPFNSLRNLMVADALDEGADDFIVGSLPTYENFTATLPFGTSMNGAMIVTKANLKALGATGLDEFFGISDGSITFNSNMPFDYDNSDGVGAGLKDFESAAIHELGHSLGFQSSAGITGTMIPSTVDLFRFQNGAAGVDPTLATFGTTARSLAAGGTPIFDDGVNEWGMSSVSDGTQASHWKDDNITGNLIGVMDPSIAFGQMFSITSADLRAFDLIGYEVVTVPGPGGLVALGLGVVGIRRRRAERAL